MSMLPSYVRQRLDMDNEDVSNFSPKRQRSLPPLSDQDQLTTSIFSMLRSHIKPNKVSFLPSVSNIELWEGLQQLFGMNCNVGLEKSVNNYLKIEIFKSKNVNDLTLTSVLINLQETLSQISCKGESLVSARAFGIPEKVELYRALDVVGISANVEVANYAGFRTSRCVYSNGEVHSPDGKLIRPALPSFKIIAALVTPGISASPQRYAFTKVLKEAIYGSVQLAIVLSDNNVWDQQPSSQVAIKVVSKAIMKAKAHLNLDENPLRELQRLFYFQDQFVKHDQGQMVIEGDIQRIVPMIDCLEDEDNYFIVMPLLQGDLMDFLQDHNGRIPERVVFRMLKDILLALEVSHSLGVAHHDISLENLLLDKDGHVSLIDWGMSVKVPLNPHQDGTSVKLKSQRGWPCQCGKKLYFSPEILDVTEDKFKSRPAFDALKLDIWSLGVVLFLLLTGLPPWDVHAGPDRTDPRYQWVLKGRIGEMLDHWKVKRPTDDALELLHALLSKKPMDRPTIREIRKFHWFTRHAAADLQ